MNNIKKVLEKCNFIIKKYKDYYNISQYTPAGEDWEIEVEKLSEFVDYAKNYEPEQDFNLWFQAKNNGVSGVPSVSELWKDQLWKQKILKGFLKGIKKI